MNQTISRVICLLLACCSFFMLGAANITPEDKENKAYFQNRPREISLFEDESQEPPTRTITLDDFDALMAYAMQRGYEIGKGREPSEVEASYLNDFEFTLQDALTLFHSNGLNLW